MTNLNIAKLYLATTTATAAQIDAAIADGSAATTVNDLTGTTLLNAIYQASFGRDADAEGLAYWGASTLTGDALVTAINAGAAVYVANDAYPENVAIAANDTVVVVNKAAATTAAAAISVGEAAAIVATVTEVATTVTAASDAVAAVVAANTPEEGQSFALTTGADDLDELTMTTGDDTVDGSIADSLNSVDRVIDSISTDNDTLNATVGVANITPTVKNIENVNVTWTSNASLNMDLVNSTGNTYNLGASGLAFSGSSVITRTGTNDINAGTDITSDLQVDDIVLSTIDAGSAKTIELSGGTPATVGALTTATLTVNNDITQLDTTTGAGTVGAAISTINLSATADASVTMITAGLITATTALNITGDKSITIVSDDISTSTISNELTAGTLTVKSTQAGANDLTKMDADLVNFAAAATTVTVNDNQDLGVVTGGSLTSIAAKAGLTNVTTNLTTGINVVGLTVTGIKSLNLEVTDTATIGLTTGATNNVTVTGSGNTTINSTGIAAIDASALTGTFTYVSAAAATGVIGSATNVNTITFTAAGANNQTFVGGSANDTLTIGAAATGTLNLDGGAGSADVLNLTNVNAISGATTTISNFEEITAITATVFTEAQLSGETFNMTGAGSSNLIVNVANAAVATTVTTDLSGLTFNTTVGSDFSTTAITGVDNAIDVITATALNDTIDAGIMADIITLGTGMDILAIDDTAGDSTELKMDSITGFTADALTAAKGGDSLDFTTAGITHGATASTSITAAIKGNNNSEVAFAETSAAGLMTLSGVDSDQVNELSEWIDAAQILLAVGFGAGETLAFEFSGNTYVVSDGAATGAADDAIVELVGLTGVTGVDATGAATVIDLA